MSYRCRVVLVDDHAVVRAGIKLLIEVTKRFEVVGEADNGEAAIERVAALRPDLVVMDIRMPGLDGIATTRRILDRNPDVRVLVFTAYDAPEYVEAAIEAGAMGCLSKRRARSDLVAALDMLASGRMTFPAHVTGLTVEEGEHRAATAPRLGLAQRARTRNAAPHRGRLHGRRDRAQAPPVPEDRRELPNLPEEQAGCQDPSRSHARRRGIGTHHGYAAGCRDRAGGPVGARSDPTWPRALAAVSDVPETVRNVLGHSGHMGLAHGLTTL